MSSPFLYMNTIRHLKPGQVAWRLLQRLPRAAPDGDVRLRERRGRWTTPVAFAPAPLRQPSRLHEYTLHYQRNPSLAEVERWIAQNPFGRGAGWEPYPLSLRMVNWIKWILSAEPPSPRLLEKSLAAQASYLSRHVERHLLANHIFMNGTALAFAGTFFRHEGWLRQGLEILKAEIPEQVLADGGHFERSPMYHSLVLEALLDLLNLRAAYPGLLPDWSAVTSRMLAWLRNMTHPDGQIAFFNDAAWDVAPPPCLLFDYASRLSVPASDVRLGKSGYIRLENAGSVVLFDAAALGPDYQPGHAHADTLSFELSHRGRRILVNSGISTYEKGPQRASERGTAAHNTLRIDGLDSSEVWAAFRVARRAYPCAVKTAADNIAEAAHTGYTRLRPPVVHRRRLELGPQCLQVTDFIEGTGTHLVEIFFHLQPGAQAGIRLDPKLCRFQEQTFFHPGFELSLPNQTVIGRYRGPCLVKFESCIWLD
ncbi:MAG: heparinase II/III family protein [Chlamydiota bacterium]